nr:putative sodium-dependent multivitamin transporter [Bactrocera oleae]XP_036230711.1 putative sodium-dependent multivitamin transporter [Bactrocera oleae]
MEPSFDGWDFAVLITVLSISASIGIYYRYTGGKQKTIKEYLLADQSMTTFPVAVSLMASFMSSISLLGISNESYQFGTMFCIINLSYIISTPITVYLFLPVFYRMRTMSVYEYLERRFGRSTRLAASIAYSIQMILYTGIVLYAPALALEAVTGVSKVTAISAIGLICTFYSTIGGLKAVLITDVFQSILMFVAIYAVIVVSAIKAGGLAPIWQVAEARNRIYFTDFSLDPTVRHSWLSLIIGGMVIYMSVNAVNQVQVQRLLSVRNLKSAQAALWWNVPILSALSLSTLFSGLAIFHYYKDCDPLLEGRIESRDQLMPIFAVDTMGQYPGLCGLFVSGIFSASLSSVSSAVSSLSTVTLEDYIKPLYKHFTKTPLHEIESTLPSKIMACIYGVVCIGMAFTASSMGGVLQASLTIFGVVGGPLLALFTLGLFTTRANQRGVLLGLLIGLIFSFIIGFGGPKQPPTTLDFKDDGCPAAGNMTLAVAALTHSFNMTTAQPTTALPPIEYNWFYRLSYMWYCVIGFLITLIGGYVLSLLLEALKWADNKQIYLDHQQIDVDLFIPPLARRLRRHDAEEMTKF